ncbi:glycosyltransferase family 2 protein [Qipengyuania nanhaisediminis]|uniref:glycosyltransferase family 2 protein n=1 Tax=Qipengyuania nanhaisediminis TaxID=604088 RepID=UPI0038B40191
MNTPETCCARPELTSPDQAEVTVIIVSWNTRDLTLKAIETLLDNAGDVSMHVVVWDNDSKDGSAEAIAEQFPGLRVIAHDENIGFALANNRVAEMATSEWLLLLNPDTETHPRAIENLLRFAKAHPEAGIVGGRTVFPDGSLNPASCWRKSTPWSLFCQAFGLSRMFPDSPVFNYEAIGGWRRDSVREVDIVVGCFFMIRRALWEELGGFDRKYVMYGEEADMCLRAAERGYRPMITPDAQIMHLVGASTNLRSEKQIRLMKARVSLIDDHWPAAFKPIGRALMWFWIANRRLASKLIGLVSKNRGDAEEWRKIWNARHEWLRGY